MINEKVVAEISYTDAMRIAAMLRKHERTPYRSIADRPPVSFPMISHCAVQITGTRDNVTNMFPGHIVVLNSYDMTWENADGSDVPRECWLILDPADIGLQENDIDVIGYTLNGMLISELPSDKKPIVLRSQEKTGIATTPIPTTTLTPCSGDCLFTYTHSTKTWALTTDTCGSGCECEPPTFCPTLPIGSTCDSTLTYSTNCRRTDTAITTYPNCTGTTSTTVSPGVTTTTTLPPSCGTQCKWYYDEFGGGWVRLEPETYNCGSQCFCDTPSTLPGGNCASYFTPCKMPALTTQPPCGGQCGWVYTLQGWVKRYSICTGNCTCDEPPYVAVCNDTDITECYPPGGGPPSYTTRLPTPGTCDSYCIWQYQSAAWVMVVSNCPYCTCLAPTGSGTECEYRMQACGFATTTTAAPTTTTTSTTSAPGVCLRKCFYDLFIDSCSPVVFKWYLRGSECNTIPPSVRCRPGFDPGFGPGEYESYLNCLNVVGGCNYWTTNSELTPAIFPYPMPTCPLATSKQYCCDGTDFPTTTTTVSPTPTTAIPV